MVIREKRVDKETICAPNWASLLNLVANIAVIAAVGALEATVHTIATTVSTWQRRRPKTVIQGNRTSLIKIA